jgi:large subunit ribosomal protein L10
VSELVSLLDKEKVIGVVSVENIPSSQLQKMRKSLRGRIKILMTKNSLLSIALRTASERKKGLEGLLASVRGQSALVVTDLNPFRLMKEIEKTKTQAPAKGGEIVSEDLEVRAGETSFKPGPIVGELQKAGIPAGIEEGKVIVKKDKVLVKAGQPIPKELAPILARLEIYPITVELDLRAAFDAGTVYKKDVLQIDDNAVRNDIMLAHTRAFNLAFSIAYPTKLTIVPLLQKAHSEALGVALYANIINRETLPRLLAKAHSQMLALQKSIGIL